MTWTSFVEALSGAAAAIGLKPSFVAGVFGAVVSLKFLPDMHGAWERLCMVSSGALVAGYTAPIAVAFFDMKSQGGESSVTFLIGLFGMSIAAAVIKMIRDAALWDLVKARWGGGK